MIPHAHITSFIHPPTGAHDAAHLVGALPAVGEARTVGVRDALRRVVVCERDEGRPVARAGALHQQDTAVARVRDGDGVVGDHHARGGGAAVVILAARRCGRLAQQLRVRAQEAVLQG